MRSASKSIWSGLTSADDNHLRAVRGGKQLSNQGASDSSRAADNYGAIRTHTLQDSRKTPRLSRFAGGLGGIHSCPNDANVIAGRNNFDLVALQRA